MFFGQRSEIFSPKNEKYQVPFRFCVCVCEKEKNVIRFDKLNFYLNTVFKTIPVLHTKTAKYEARLDPYSSYVGYGISKAADNSSSYHGLYWLAR